MAINPHTHRLGRDEPPKRRPDRFSSGRGRPHQRRRLPAPTGIIPRLRLAPHWPEPDEADFGGSSAL